MPNFCILQDKLITTEDIYKFNIDKNSDYENMKNQYIRSEYQYARRQLTWFRRMSNINWFEADDKNLIDKTSLLIADFLK